MSGQSFVTSAYRATSSRVASKLADRLHILRLLRLLPLEFGDLSGIKLGYNAVVSDAMNLLIPSRPRWNRCILQT